MAGETASRTMPLGPMAGSRDISCVIQIKAPGARALNDRAVSPEQPAGLTAQEDKQP